MTHLPTLLFLHKYPKDSLITDVFVTSTMSTLLGITEQFLLDTLTGVFSYLLAQANFAVLGQSQALGN